MLPAMVLLLVVEDPSARERDGGQRDDRGRRRCCRWLLVLDPCADVDRAVDRVRVGVVRAVDRRLRRLRLVALVLVRVLLAGLRGALVGTRLRVAVDRRLWALLGQGYVRAVHRRLGAVLAASPEGAGGRTLGRLAVATLLASVEAALAGAVAVVTSSGLDLLLDAHVERLGTAGWVGVPCGHGDHTDDDDESREQLVSSRECEHGNHFPSGVYWLSPHRGRGHKARIYKLSIRNRCDWVV